MRNNKMSVFQQTIEEAERQGSAFAETIKDSFSVEETELGDFVDMLFYLYYLMDNKQFIDFLMILSDVYDISLLPDIEDCRMYDDKADIYISIFLKTFLFRLMAVLGDYD